mmetsp:Transcript_18796/g.43197  ORF Transcript_18796/g.43197 Transcript_18796/m.43197 type:complete len:215 (+) Transcript_18796:1329-1973(+)
MHHLPQHRVQLDLRGEGRHVDLLGVAAERDVLRSRLAEEGENFVHVLVDLGLELDDQVAGHAGGKRSWVAVGDGEEVLDRVRQLQEFERVEREGSVRQRDLLPVRLARLEVNELHCADVPPLLGRHKCCSLELPPPHHLLLDPPVPSLLPLHRLLEVLLLQLRQPVAPSPFSVHPHTLGRVPDALELRHRKLLLLLLLLPDFLAAPLAPLLLPC